MRCWITQCWDANMWQPTIRLVVWFKHSYVWEKSSLNWPPNLVLGRCDFPIQFPFTHGSFESNFIDLTKMFSQCVSLNYVRCNVNRRPPYREIERERERERIGNEGIGIKPVSPSGASFFIWFVNCGFASVVGTFVCTTWIFDVY